MRTLPQSCALQSSSATLFRRLKTFEHTIPSSPICTYLSRSFDTLIPCTYCSLMRPEDPACNFKTTSCQLSCLVEQYSLLTSSPKRRLSPLQSYSSTSRKCQLRDRARSTFFQLTEDVVHGLLCVGTVRCCQVEAVSVLRRDCIVRTKASGDLRQVCAIPKISLL